ncbi:MAG: hypothetical protein RL417_362 [Pseudomonadota bacterium]|jgi:hypothetical protein
MFTPSEFRRVFGPGESPSRSTPEKESGCLMGCLGTAAVAAVLLGASFGVTRCERLGSAEGGDAATGAPLPPEPNGDVGGESGG